MKLRFLLTILFLFHGSQKLIAQKNKHFWLNYRLTKKLENQLELGTKLSYEKMYTPNRWGRINLGTFLSKKLKNKLQLQSGLNAYYTQINNSDDTGEFRLWEKVSYPFPVFEDLFFSHHLKFEQRFLFSTKNFDFSSRIRYKLNSFINLSKKNKDYLILGLEYFYNAVSDDNLDYFRVISKYFLGFNKELNPTNRISILFNFQRIRPEPHARIKTTDYILELNFTHKITKSK